MMDFVFRNSLNRPEGVSEVCLAVPQGNNRLADLRIRSEHEIFLGAALEEASPISMNGVIISTADSPAYTPPFFEDCMLTNLVGERVSQTSAYSDQAILAHFTSTTSTEMILKGKTLRLSSFAGANDDLECKDWLFDLYCTEETAPPNGARDISKHIKNDFKDHWKYASFCYEVGNVVNLQHSDIWKSPAMWAAYGGRHRPTQTGSVLIFERNQLLKSAVGVNADKGIYSGKVTYVDDQTARERFRIDYDLLCKLGYQEYMEQHISQFWKELLFLKYSGWQHENEYRIVAFDNESSEIYVPILGSLKTIVIGEGVDQGQRDKLEELAKPIGAEVRLARWRNGVPCLL